MLNPFLFFATFVVTASLLGLKSTSTSALIFPQISKDSSVASTAKLGRIDTSMASLPIDTLLDASSGQELSSESKSDRLRNKRVALYFSAGWCPMCTSFEPSLLQFQEACKDSGKDIEIIYISSDRNEEDAYKRAASLRMSTTSLEKSAELKKKYQIWAGSESIKFGFIGRRSGVPALVVLDKTGEEMAFIKAESEGVKSLQSWPLDNPNGIWDK